MNLIIVLSLIVMLAARPTSRPTNRTEGGNPGRKYTQREIVTLRRAGRIVFPLYPAEREKTNFPFATMATDNGIPELDDIHKKYFTKSQVEGEHFLLMHCVDPEVGI